ncbi:MAG: FAD:protein FMN transferase [Saprospiraceae bacterium]|nr:FAD:protein FMN transferase [Saprospiraceae bacterium]
MKYFFYLFYVSLFFKVNAQSTQKYTFQGPKMGTLIQVRIADQDSIIALNAAQEVFKLYDTLNQILSDYLPNSELNELCRKAGTAEWTMVSEHLLNVLILSQEAYDISNGAFDPSVGRLVQLWRGVRKSKIFPDEQMLLEALQTKGFKLKHDIEINKNQVRLNKKGVQLDFGGIAKGYAAQCGLDLLKKRGITAVLIDSGGDLVLGDAPQNSKGWKIGINRPDDANETLPYFLEIANCSVATSGNLYQSVEIEGKTYSHILNPKTGIGMTHQRNVTVIASDGATADWLATACSVLSIAKAKKLIRRINKNMENPENQAKLLITYWKKGKIKEQKHGKFDWISLN